MPVPVSPPLSYIFSHPPPSSFSCYPFSPFQEKTIINLKKITIGFIKQKQKKKTIYINKREQFLLVVIRILIIFYIYEMIKKLQFFIRFKTKTKQNKNMEKWIKWFGVECDIAEENRITMSETA